MLAFFQKTISNVFRGDWLFRRECSSSGTQSWGKSFLNLNVAILYFIIHITGSTKFHRPLNNSLSWLKRIGLSWLKRIGICGLICSLFNYILQILKPAFTILVDHNTKRLLLLIRGTHSIKDTLTAATGAVVPFHHSVVHEGGVSNLVLGYAHCGMVAAARWIAKLATPCIIKGLVENPGYKLKVTLKWACPGSVTFILLSTHFSSPESSGDCHVT